MTAWKDMGTGLRALLLGGGAAAAAAAGTLVWRASSPSAPEASPPVAASVEASAPAEPAQATAETTAPASAAPEPAPPRAPNFDVVRVSPEGAAVIAGTAEAGSDVSLRVDGAEVARAETDATGSFVSLFSLEPSDKARVVTLVATLDDGREVPSAASVLIAPTPAPLELAEAPVAEAAPEATPPAAEPEPAAPTAEPPTPPEPAEAPAAVLLSDEGAKLLQPATIDPEFARNVTIDTLSYSTTGDVQLAGRAAAGGVVRLYVDNALLLETKIGEDGTWSGTLPAVEAGVYMLRADQVDAEGRVLSRYETPFQREAPALLTGAGGQVASKITVQPGFTLWGIARDSYGDGVMYVRVYEANKAQIRDPDLIYPGQVFTVPQKE